ncbi:LemA family protein [Marinobacter pelagius]|uniref:LemA family protein n=1 Tax=Marinobacter sp. C7 TaxID=2951363 RepID=UPI001EF0F077|nr:LemA family protein [Marinobacter sp. C7]MCG7198839.1 LemA family protein [Marinobacter sp. C7]
MRRINIASVPGRIVMALLAIASLAGTYHLMQTGLNQLAEARQMQRLPETPIGALSEGPYVFAGEVQQATGTVTTPYSNTEAVYYRYKLEEEYRDSDGDLRVRTLDAGARGGSFRVRDHSGGVLVEPGHDLSSVEWNIARSYRSRSGNRIYSEWALQPGESVRILGRYDGENQAIGFSGLRYFSLPALVSDRSLETDSGDRLFEAAIRISIATGLLALGLALALTALKVHRFWVYVLAMTLAVTGTLSALGIAKLKQEWSAIATLYETRYEQLNRHGNDPLLLADVAALQQLIRQSTSGWLDRWMFRSLAEKRLPIPELDGQSADRARQIVDNAPQGRYQHTVKSWALAAGSALLSVVLIFLAIRTVKLKRLIEAVPTSSTRGLSFGLSELKGMVDVDNAHPPIRDPLKNEKCVAYDYKVEERDGGGKDDKWRTVEHRAERVPFWLEDPHGRVLVHPEGATIEYPKFHQETRGDRRYTVRLLDTFVNVYCLGFAGLDREQSDHLSIQRDDSSPFLISANEEEDIVLDRGARGFVGIALSLGLSLFAATTLFAVDGTFSPDNLMMAALAVPLVLCVYIGILHYNDIVFLKNRVNRARANIDTILQQRHDLWPNLEKVVMASMAHEKQLLKAIAQLRAANPAKMKSQAEVEKLIGFEQKVTRAMQARIENYPDLKNNEVIGKFMAIMAETENYLSLLRNSYTESAMLYNTRIQSLPDVILAKLFRFRAAPQFVAAG